MVTILIGLVVSLGS